MIVLECDKVFTAKASRNRHVWQDYHKYDDQGSPIQTVRFICIAQKVYEKVNLICKFCGHGEKDGGPFIGRHRTAQHSLGRTCTMRIFHYQKKEWYPGPLLVPTEENIEMLIRESDDVYECLRTKFETFFKQGERNTRKRKQAGVQPATLNKAEKRRTDGRGFFIKDINAVIPDPRTPPKKIVRLNRQTVTPPYSDTTLHDTTLFDTTGSDTTLFDTTGTDTTLFGTTGSDTTLFGTNAQSGKCSSF